MAVVLFHYAPSWFQGGFVGVDIFFVISGYLITGILVGSFAHQSLPIVLFDFYQRRIRRIFPAAIIVLSALMIASWLSLFPHEFIELAKHVFASAAFFENFFLWTQAGYFDSEAIKKPLLHFWSLAVEEQFYLVWPIIFWLFIKKHWRLAQATLVVILLSFVVNIFNVLIDESAAFYLPLGRFWELLLGALLAIAQKNNCSFLRIGRGLHDCIGLVLIIAGFMLISPGVAYPWFWAILPVAGSAFFINAGSYGVLSRTVASWRPIVLIGLISYPLYLWHWALLSFAALVFEKRLPGLSWAQTKIALFVASVVLAWLTYKVVEIPIRRRGGTKTSITLICIMALVAITALVVIQKNGFEQRTVSMVNNSNAAKTYLASLARTEKEGQCFNLQKQAQLLWSDKLPDPFYCLLGNHSSNKTIVVYGDSHSLSMVPVFDLFGQEYDYRIVYSGIDACLPVPGITHDYNKQAACNELALKMPELARQEQAKAAVLIQSWGGYPEKIAVDGLNCSGLQQESAFACGLAQLSRHYAKSATKLILMLDNPRQNMPPPIDQVRFSDTFTDESINALAIIKQDYFKSQQNVNNIMTALSASDNNLYLIDNSAAFCTADICPLAKDGHFLYYDDNHLSSFGAMQAYENIVENMQDILKEDF